MRPLVRRCFLAATVAGVALSLAVCSEAPKQNAGAPAEIAEGSVPIMDEEPAATPDAAAPDEPNLGDEPVDPAYEPCPVLRQPAPATLCEYYTAQWESLEDGRGAIDRPDEMQRGETASVTLVLGRPEEDGTPIDETMDNLLGSEADQQFDVRVGRKMAAELRGNGFAIEPEGIVAKDLFLGQGQRWDWKITALKNPTHELRVITYAVVDSPDGEKESLLRTEAIDIPVRLSWQHWISDRTEDLSLLEKFLLGLAALVGAGGAVWLALKKLKSGASGARSL